MIILSGVLVVVAIALLVAGIVAGNGDSAQVFGLDALTVIYISIAVSIVSALCLAIGVFLRRKELFGAGAPAGGPARKGRKAKRPRPAPPVPAATSAMGAPAAPRTAVDLPAEPDDEIDLPAQPVDVPDDAMVFVVRGRKRYHLDTCRQLAGRDTEELTYAEAKEEGFSPCTACMPDTALAARAAASGPGSPDPGRTVVDGPDLTKPGVERSPAGPEGGLAGLARPAPAAPHASPTPFDRTAEFPRTSEPAEHAERSGPSGGRHEEPAARVPSAWSSSPADPEPEEPPAPSPAGPTLMDIPVAGLPRLHGRPEPAEEPADEPEEADAAVAEPEAAHADDRAAGDRARDERAHGDRTAESLPSPDVTVDLGPDPLKLRDAAPRPRDAEDEAVPEPAAPSALDEEPDETRDEAPAGEPEAAGSDEPAADDDGPQVRILSGTKRYHRTDCALIEDIGDEADDLEALSRTEAKARGCTPCLVCQPDREVV